MQPCRIPYDLSCFADQDLQGDQLSPTEKRELTVRKQSAIKNCLIKKAFRSIFNFCNIQEELRLQQGQGIQVDQQIPRKKNICHK